MSNIWDRERLLRSTIIAGFAAAGMAMSPAYAQEADTVPAPAPESEAAEDTIIVTGSRIQRSGFDMTQPTEVIGAAEISLRGYTNAADAVLDLPSVIGNTPQGNQGTSGVGQNLLNLYGLGTNRTLTLINGRRFVSSNSPVGGSGNPGSQVDVNNIPVAMIERVDVVKVGGAPVYGSDAVAGVVNFVLRDDYEGAEFAADYEQWGEDNIGSEYSLRATIGGNFSNGRGNIVTSLEYNETTPVLESDVADLAENWSRFQVPGGGVIDPATGSVPVGQVRAIPNATAGIVSFSGLATPGAAAITNLGIGRFPDGNFYQFDPSGSGLYVPYDPGQPTTNAVWAIGGDGLVLDGITPFRSPYRRFNFSTFVNYELTDRLNFSMDMFANTFEATEPVNQPFYASGLFGATSFSLFFPNTYAFMDPTVVATNVANGLSGIYLQKGFIDLGNKSYFNETNVFSFNFGLDGDFDAFGRNFLWDLSYQTGETSIVSSQSDLSEDRFFAALDVGINPGTGQIDCRFNYEAGYAAPLAGGFGAIDDIGTLGEAGECAPLDPFRGASAEAADYVLVEKTDLTVIEQEIVSGYITTDLFDVPAGTVGFATGFEHRREYASYRPGAGNELSVTRDGGNKGTEGEYYTSDVYGEVLVPLLGGDFTLPFVEAAEMEASYRRIDNSRSGVAEAYAVGINAMFAENITLRLNSARTVRAPAVTELFLPRVQAGSFAADPCDFTRVNAGPNPAVRAANCAADGLPTNFVSVAGNASVQGFNGGNPNLSNELADSYNIGLVFNPRWVPGLTLSVDYVNITLTDAITTFTLTQIMSACYDSASFPNSFCGAFTRLPNGQLPSLNAYTAGYVNAASRTLDAVEVAARYTGAVNELPFIGNPSADWGDFDINLRVYNLQTNTTSATGFDFDDSVGEVSDPDWRGDVRAQWYRGPVTLWTDIEYSGSGLFNKFASSPYSYLDENGQVFHNIDSTTTVDIGGQYDVNNLSFRASIDNVFDDHPDNVQKAYNGAFSLGRIFHFGVTSRF